MSSTADAELVNVLGEAALRLDREIPPTSPPVTGDGLFTGTVTGGLALRLGAAAAGLEGLGAFYLVACFEPVFSQADPYDVIPLTNAQLAVGLAKLLTDATGKRFSAFGPFDQQEANPPQQPTLMTLAGTMSDADSGEIDARQYDALFWSISAVRKFALPYYTSLYSPEYASDVDEAFQNAEFGVMAHMPWTEYVMMDAATAEESSGDSGSNPAADGVPERLRNATVAPSGRGKSYGQHVPERFHIPVFFKRGDDGKLQPHALLPY